MEKRQTVWVIDDDDIHQLFTRKTLQYLKICENIQSFYFSMEAMNTLENLIATKGILPDMIFLDINMPYMDGWEFLDAYRKLRHKLSKPIDIFMVSSSIADSDKERARSYKEISDFIIKPISPQTLGPYLD